jgi:hypothetical protein
LSIWLVYSLSLRDQLSNSSTDNGIIGSKFDVTALPQFGVVEAPGGDMDAATACSAEGARRVTCSGGLEKDVIEHLQVGWVRHS